MSSAPAFWQCPRCKTPNPWAAYLTACVSCGEPRPPAEARAVFAPKPESVRPSGRRIAVATYAYAVVVLVVLALIKGLGDRWWPATVLMFAPRWLFLFPILPLAAWAGWERRFRLLAAQGAILAVVLVPLMGLCLPVRSFLASAPQGERVRVLSLNRGLAELDSMALTRLIADQRIDVVCLQEFRPDPILDAYFATTGWHRDRRGSIFSRLPIVHDLDDKEGPHPEYGFWPLRLNRVRVRLADGREAIVASVHMPTMTYGFQKLLRGDLTWFNRYTEWRKSRAVALLDSLRETADLPTIIGGDFNMPPDSPIMGVIRRTYASGFEEVGWGFGYTRPSRASWIGIDRILASRDVKFRWCRVGPLVGSDHRPILAEVVVSSP